MAIRTRLAIKPPQQDVLVHSSETRNPSYEDAYNGDVQRPEIEDMLRITRQPCRNALGWDVARPLSALRRPLWRI